MGTIVKWWSGMPPAMRIGFVVLVVELIVVTVAAVTGVRLECAVVP